MKENGKGFKVEETKSPFEYLKPSFHKITLNDKNKKDNNNDLEKVKKLIDKSYELIKDWWFKFINPFYFKLIIFYYIILF